MLCVLSTALEVPVVPLVRMMTDSSSAERSTWASWSSAPSIERGEVELVGAGLAQDYHAAEPAVGRLSRVDGVGEPGLIRNGLAVHHVHDAGDLAGEEVGVDGHGRGADLLRGEKDEDDLGAVAEHIGDAVALAEADGGEGVGQPVHRPVELGPGVGLVLVDKGEPIGIHLRVADEEVFKLKHF